MKKSVKLLIWIPSGIIMLFLLVLTLISILSQILLSPTVSEKVIREYAPKYYEGSFEMGRASISVFRHFPRLTVDIDSLQLTYEAARFEKEAGERIDTLASFRKFSASLNTLALFKGVLQLNDVILEHPRVFVKLYDEKLNNWNIIRLDTGEKTEAVRTKKGTVYIPHFVFNRMSVGGDPLMEYSDIRNDVYATLRMKDYIFDGKLNTSAFHKSSFRSSLDSLTLEGRSAGDTLRYLMDFNVFSHKGAMDVQLRTQTMVSTMENGKAMVPFDLDGKVDASNRWDGVLCLDMHNVDVSIATIKMQADMKMVLDKKIDMKGTLHLAEVDVQEVLDNYMNKVMSQTRGIHTNMLVTADVEVDGKLDPAGTQIPDFSAVVNIPRSYIYHDEFNYRPELELITTVKSTTDHGVDALLSKCNIYAPGLKLTATGQVCNMTSASPDVDITCKMKACLDSLGRATDEKFEIRVGGSLDLDAKGKFNLSNLRDYNFANADVDASIKLRNVVFASRPDDMIAKVDRLDLKAALMDDRFLQEAKIKDRSLGAKLDIGKVDFRYGKTVSATVGKLGAFFLNASDKVDFADTLRFHPLRASVDVSDVKAVINDTIKVALASSGTSIKQLPSRENARIPVIELKTDNKGIAADVGEMRASLEQLRFNGKMKMAAVHNRRRLITRLDSMNRLHPELMPDSMWRFLVQNPHSPKLPHFMAGSDAARAAEAAKKAQNPMRKFYEKWNVDGSLSLSKAGVFTPAFPVEARLEALDVALNNDVLQIDRLNAGAGSSKIAVEGAVSNIRKAFLADGDYKVNVAVDCDTLALTEIVNALPHTQGAKPAPAKIVAGSQDVVRPDLVVVPGKVDGLLTVRSKGMSLGGLHVSDFKTDAAVHNRCIQLMGTRAVMGTGGLNVEAYYSTPTPDKADLGFDLDMKNILVDQVIAIVPGIDSLAGIMKSFRGSVNCQTAATLSLDKAMNLVPASMSGVLRFTADTLHFTENKQVTSIARLLWVKNASHATIDHLNVEAMLHDGEVEIFPFGVKLENWELALAGVQHLDQSLDYHISLIRCPFGLRLGMNLSGKDFEHIKFKLGKSQYRKLSDIPSFSGEIDATRAALVQNIRSIFDSGSEKAIENHRKLEALRAARRERNYHDSVAIQPLDEMSDADKAVVEQLNRK